MAYDFNDLEPTMGLRVRRVIVNLLEARRFIAMQKSKVESLSVRMPSAIREWLAREAADAVRSESAQVVVILKERMAQQEKAAQ
jgi:hypothetical protein